jgi:hypothetical protein
MALKPWSIQRRALSPAEGICRDAVRGADQKPPHNQIRDQAIVYVQHPFGLGPIPHVVAFRQHAPDLRTEPKRVRQYLKNDVSFRWSESVVPERGKTGSPVLRTVPRREPELIARG